MQELPSLTFPTTTLSLSPEHSLKAPSRAVRYSHSKAIADLSRDLPMPRVSVSVEEAKYEHDPIDENLSMSPLSTTTEAVSDFWRYFQDESSLQFVVSGGNPDAIIGLFEAKVLLSNLRGCLFHRIPDDDAGVKHLRGRSVRELRHFLTALDFDSAVGGCVVRDLACGGAVGSARASLIRAQKDKIASHLRKHTTDHISPRSTMTLSIPFRRSTYGSELLPPLLYNALSAASASSRMSGVSAASDSLSLSWPPTPSAAAIPSPMDRSDALGHTFAFEPVATIPRLSSMEHLSGVSGEMDVEEITVDTTALMSDAWMHAVEETDKSILLLTNAMGDATRKSGTSALFSKRYSHLESASMSLDPWVLRSAVDSTHAPSESMVASEVRVAGATSLCVERLAALMHAPIGV